MFLACNVTSFNFDGKFTSMSPIGEARGVSLPTLFANEVKPKWLIAPVVFYLLLITNVEPHDPISIYFRPNIMVLE
jgi:hypothetical protein